MDEQEERDAYIRAYSLALGALPSMLTRAACKLGIPDILHAQQGHPLSALQITSKLPFPRHLPPPPLLETAVRLDRILRFLCSHGVFKAHVDPTSSSPTTYSLTSVSKWLLRPPGKHYSHPPGISLTSSSDVAYQCPQASSSGDSACPGTTSSSQVNVGAISTDMDDTCLGGSAASDDLIPKREYVNGACAGHVGAESNDAGNTCDKRLSLQDFLLFQTCGVLQPPLQHLAQFILEGGEGPFYKAHGMNGWSFLNSHPEFSHLFNDGMACDADISVALLLQNYQGFNDVHTLVDVGGGMGTVASRIVASYPFIRALNFDLPYVVATAPTYPGVEHIGGDMFQAIPRGDAIFLRSTLHTWDDESCIKILKNCHKVLPKHGKLIIMDVVLSNDIGNKSPLDKSQVALDVLMMVNTNGGKERNKTEWQHILKAAEFQIHQVIELPCPQGIIEAFPTCDTS